MPNLNDLSERELEILHLLAEGKSNKEIATALFISTNTVKVHLRNIFSKLEVSSRTEAVLFVLRADSPGGIDELAPDSQTSSPSAGDSLSPADPLVDIPANSSSENLTEIPQSSPVRATFFRNPWLYILVLLGIGGLWSAGPSLARFLQPTATPPTESVNTLSTENSRWQFRQNLPAAKMGLAVTIYEEQIYAIGGENTQVLAEFNRYDPLTDQWEALPSKPTAVADIQAAVTGGKIYVPGGRTESGEPTNVLEIYNPQQNIWTQGASLPTPLSAYALAAFEGDLYLFGGWNGQEFTNIALRYDPTQDQWYPLTTMPIARGFASAAIVGGKIYMLGGYDGETILANNDIYTPELEQTDRSPWAEGAPLPAGRFAMGVANVADNIYLIGGENPEEEFFTQMRYSPKENTWEITTNPLAEPWARMGVVPVGTSLYALGGRLNDQPTGRNLIYQVIFSISIPIAP